MVADLCERCWDRDRDGNIDTQSLKISLIILWKIWAFRNSISHNRQALNADSLQQQIDKAIKELIGEEETNLIVASPNIINITINTEHQPKWTATLEGLWKINCNASWSEKHHRGGIGWILRGWNSFPLSVGYRTVIHRWKIPWLEALAIAEGLKTLPAIPPCPVRVECDSIQVVRLINGQEEDFTELGVFIKEIQNIASQRSIDSVVHVPRIHNYVAHYLAYLACRDNEPNSWSGMFPDWLLTLNEEK